MDTRILLNVPHGAMLRMGSQKCTDPTTGRSIKCQRRTPPQEFQGTKAWHEISRICVIMYDGNSVLRMNSPRILQSPSRIVAEQIRGRNQLQSNGTQITIAQFPKQGCKLDTSFLIGRSLALLFTRHAH